MHSQIWSALKKLEAGEHLEARLILENAKREWDDDLKEFGPDVLLAREIVEEETAHACGLGEYKRISARPAWVGNFKNAQ